MREHPEVRLAPDHLNHYPTRGWVTTQMVIEGVGRIMSKVLTMDEASEYLGVIKSESLLQGAFSCTRADHS